MTRKLVEDSEQLITSANSALTTPGVTVDDIRSYLAKAKVNARIILTPQHAKRLYKILGENVYSSLEEVEINIDLVDIFRPSDETPNLAHQTVKIGAKTLWLQLGIFNTEAKKIVETAKINFIENKCTKKEFEKIINK